MQYKKYIKNLERHKKSFERCFYNPLNDTFVNDLKIPMKQYNISKQNSFYCVGMSYQKADAHIRGKFSLPDDAKASILNTIQEKGEDLTNWVSSGLGLGKLADGVAGEGFFDNFISGGLINKRKKAEKGMEEFVDHNADLMVFLEGKTFETSQDMIAALEDYNEYLRNYGQEDLTGGIGTSLDDATESLYNFNNAREELFFGFSSDKLTGDLVRQVKQQGVETLITSTEVIMTNNFNGDMSIPEIAQQLLDEIEMEGNKRGMIVNN